MVLRNIRTPTSGSSGNADGGDAVIASSRLRGLPIKTESQLEQYALDLRETLLPMEIERKKETDTGRLPGFVIDRGRNIHGALIAALLVTIMPLMLIPVPMTLVMATLSMIAVPVTLTLIAVPVPPILVVVSICECRRDRQTAYQRSKGDCHHNLAAG
ncbi:MAG TPA: hypothetical protein DCQ77_09005 [Betaproteobacteria bacterium]|nr:hypothetical protein [Betaproteobacteria bacterium]